jgi:isocitrate dehydrogenase kinase/phosphatase
MQAMLKMRSAPSTKRANFQIQVLSSLFYRNKARISWAASSTA